MSVKIVCDSGCDMSREEAKEKGVILLPLKTIIEGKTYLDGVDITGEEFYERLKTCSKIPTTSQVSPAEFLQAYNKIGKEDEILVISMSSEFSGTAQSARIAAEEFEGRVYTVDSRNVSVGERILLEYAIRLRDGGLGAEEIKDKLLDATGKICLVARVDTLEYLRKGGRLSKSQALAGLVLNIKPVLGIEKGAVRIYGKARGIKQSNNMLTETIKKNGVDFSMPLMLGYSGTDREMLDAYIEHSRELWEGKIEKLPVSIVGSTIGCHAGPGAVAVAYFSDKAEN